LKKNRHDYNTERSLVLLVGKRRSLLDYLKKKEINRYRDYQSIGYQKIINILKRRESAFCFIPYPKGAKLKNKKVWFSLVLGINYANNNYNTTRTHV
jgi:hypothetical protein